jgi:hypothetical protein
MRSKKGTTVNPDQAPERDEQGNTDIRHARGMRRMPASRSRLLRGIAITVTAVALGAAACSVAGHQRPASPRAGAQPHLSLPTLTRAEARQMEHATPADVARFDQYANAAYGKLGIHAGVGSAGNSPEPAKTGKATLTAFQWSGGRQWDHVWVTASYADLAPFASSLGAVASAATWFCNKLPGAWSAACGVIGSIIAYYVGKFHVPNASGNHGIWGAYYWLPWPHSTGGTW